MKLRQAMQKRDGSGWKLSKIPVIEIFGPTIQGEGMVVGQKTMFVRTAGCDYPVLGVIQRLRGMAVESILLSK